MKKFKLGLLASMCILIFGATQAFAGFFGLFGDDDEKEEAKKSDKIRVALVIPSTIDDMSWSQALYEGALAVQKEKGKEKFEIKVSERLWNAVDAGAAIRQYASQGYNIIIAHGAQYQSLLDEIAPDFPNTSFAYGTGYATNHPNIFAYDPQAQEGAFLLGMLAGMKTKSNIIGVVGPIASGDAIKFNKGFVQGVKATNEKADVRIAYTGSFGDVVAAGEIARTHIKAGADVLSGSAQQTVGAIKVAAQHKGIFWLATDMDQTPLAAETILAAQVYNFKKLITDIIDSRAQNVMGGKHIMLDFENGSIDLKFNEKLAAEITPEMKSKVDEMRKQLASGEKKIKI